MIIAILFEEFVQGGAVRAGRLQRQLKSKSGQQLGELRKAQFSGASVFKRIKRGAADARLTRERGLAELEFPAALGDLLPYRG
ncbi:MAG: hypothetical protein WAN72_08495 [Candidatus Acidiferrales bacterium]